MYSFGFKTLIEIIPNFLKIIAKKLKAYYIMIIIFNLMLIISFFTCNTEKLGKEFKMINIKLKIFIKLCSTKTL